VVRQRLVDLWHRQRRSKREVRDRRTFSEICGSRPVCARSIEPLNSSW
jgi:hypothetical protein